MDRRRSRVDYLREQAHATRHDGLDDKLESSMHRVLFKGSSSVETRCRKIRQAKYAIDAWKSRVEFVKKHHKEISKLSIPTSLLLAGLTFTGGVVTGLLFAPLVAGLSIAAVYSADIIVPLIAKLQIRLLENKISKNFLRLQDSVRTFRTVTHALESEDKNRKKMNLNGGIDLRANAEVAEQYKRGEIDKIVDVLHKGNAVLPPSEALNKIKPRSLWKRFLLAISFNAKVPEFSQAEMIGNAGRLEKSIFDYRPKSVTEVTTGVLGRMFNAVSKAINYVVKSAFNLVLPEDKKIIASPDKQEPHMVDLGDLESVPAHLNSDMGKSKELDEMSDTSVELEMKPELSALKTTR